MNAILLERRFAKIGARALLRASRNGALAIDVRRDAQGEYYDIAVGRAGARDLDVVDVQPADRHLLLLSRDDDGKHKFLCGHDERHWFVAAVPESSSAATVLTAKEALKPAEVVGRQRQLKVKVRNRNRRRNEAFVRQGEWFFVPFDGSVSERWILRNEPISRGRGKPHVVGELVREGGETVYVSVRYPNGLTQEQYARVLADEPDRARDRWQAMRRNARVYARGKVRHADHKTIVLDGWHLVVMNTETRAAAMQNVAFLD